ncbi:hypothetical protein WNB94_08105 [Aquabacterium sp. A3]|uniref:hypothetical protein n=1 Tax=Aquabacterium sp. A3 TaxID=3132829 RepID=UPI00311A2764
MTQPHTTRRPTCIVALSLAAALGLSACASKPKATTQADGRVVEHEEAVTDRVGGAVLTPLSDLNMVRSEIPAVLQDAVDQGAYHPPQELSCQHIGEQIILLNAALGSDLDAPKGGDVSSWLERGSDFAEDSGVGMVRRTVEGVVPFRSWLRKLSGAERHSRRVSQAIVTGGIRRAFLKGVGAQLGCVPPAAPLSVAAPPAVASAPQP